MKYGRLLKISNKDFCFLFPSLKNNSKEIKSFKGLLIKYIIRDKSLLKRYGIKLNNNESYLKDKIKDIPIWEISNYWTFEIIIKILKLTRKEIRDSIIKYYLNNDAKNIDKYILSNFTSTLEILKMIRNKICHNNEIININFSKNSDNFHNFMKLMSKNYLFKNNNEKINIKHICEYINVMWFKKNNFEKNMKNLFKKYEKLFSSKNLWSSIKLKMGFPN